MAEIVPIATMYIPVAISPFFGHKLSFQPSIVRLSSIMGGGDLACLPVFDKREEAVKLAKDNVRSGNWKGYAVLCLDKNRGVEYVAYNVPG